MEYLASEIAAIFSEAEFRGYGAAPITAPVSPEQIREGNGGHGLAWCKPGKEADFPQGPPIGLLIANEESLALLPGLNAKAVLVVDAPRRVFGQILSRFFARLREARIESTAIIHPTATLGSHVYIGHYVVVEAGCQIGDRSEVLHHTVLMEGTRVGTDVSIGCHCTIGQPGFGYEPDEAGHQQLIEHTGYVDIGDHARIHNNTCIDRAVLGRTVIEPWARIDNLVHLAHGVRIGQDAMVIANAMIAGSARIGAGAWIAPSVNVLNQIEIGAGAQTGMGANIVKTVAANETVVGSPAEPIERFKRWLKVRKGLLGE